jgi:hypothetical protein
VYPLFTFATVSLVFMDLEVVQIAGKSIVLPYVATLALGVALLARPARLRGAFADPVLPFLIAWVGLACFSAALGYARFYREPFLRYERLDLLRRDTTQSLNLLLMLTQYVIFACAIRSMPPRQTVRIVRVFVTVGLVGSLYALYQMGFVIFGWPYCEWFRTANLYLHAESLEPGGFGGWIRVPRAFGTAPEPSLWGAYLAVVLAFLLGSVGMRRRWMGLPTVAAVVLVLLAILVTFSRSTWVTVVALLLLWALARLAGRLPAWAMGVVLVGALGATLWPAIIVRGSTTVFSDLSTLERMSAHLTGLNMLADNPLFGIGFGSIEFFISRYAVLLPGYDEIRFITVFSFFLLVFVSTGIVGACLFWTFLVRLMVTLHHSFDLPVADPGLVGLRLGTALACMAVLTSWLNHPAYNFTYIWFALALGAATRQITAAAALGAARQ